VLLRADPPLHLTYCTNIHPAEGWNAAEATLRQIAPALKARLSPDAPFGLGLRLGAREARELLAPSRLDAFKAWLEADGLYVAILNGFPYGPFHGEPVKTNVYAPDWRADARVDYTLDLAEILTTLLPEGVEGGISTVPLSYKRWMASAADEDWQRITRHVVRVAERLAQIRQASGRLIHLDIEPEPDCVLETSEETVEWFHRRLWPALAAEHRDHVQVCFDCCHCAVEYEDPAEALARLRVAGIRVGRVQISSALTADLPADPREAAVLRSRLEAFADSTYLHQVVERHDGDSRRFADLDVALRAAATSSDRQWRIHFHVPLFAAEYEGLGSSQGVVRTVLSEARSGPLTQHLEIETYTWSVLPETLRVDLQESIAREFEWVLGEWKKARS
jgi:sugar phosphate isomerase/epimerase